MGGDEALPLGVDLGTDSSPAFVVEGPPRSGPTTVLAVMAFSVPATGGQVVLVTPRRSPLRHLAGRSGVQAVLTGAEGDESRFGAAVATATAPLVVLVDDAELVVDSGLGTVLAHYLSSCRDGDRALVLAGATTDLRAGFRGLAAEAAKREQDCCSHPREHSTVTCWESDSHAASPCRGLEDGGARRASCPDHRPAALTTVQVPFLDPAADG